MSKSTILEDVRSVKLTFTEANNIVVLPTLGDGNCFFHSVLRAFNTNYIKAKSITDRVNMARTFRNALADRLEEVDPLTGKNYYAGLNNGELEKISGGVKEYSLTALQKELRSSAPVDNIYQEIISNAMNKDIYIIDGTKQDMYHVGSAFSLYYKGRNSIIIYYIPSSLSSPSLTSLPQSIPINWSNAPHLTIKFSGNNLIRSTSSPLTIHKGILSPSSP